MPTSTYNNNIEIIQSGEVTNTDGENKPIVNRFTYATVGGTAFYPVNVPVFLANFITAVGAAWKLCLSVGYLDTGISGRQMDDATFAPVTLGLGLGSGTVGSGPATMLPPEVTGYISLQTGKRGKSFRGSKHISPLDNSFITGGSFTTPAVSAFKALLTAMLATVSDGTNGFNLTVMSQVNSQTAINPVNVSAQKVLIDPPSYVSREPGTQRHRKFKNLRS